MLYLTDAIDEATVTNLQKYADRELVDVTKEGLNVRDCFEFKFNFLNLNVLNVRQLYFYFALTHLATALTHLARQLACTLT